MYCTFAVNSVVSGEVPGVCGGKSELPAAAAAPD